jgi:hypothetical protein
MDILTDLAYGKSFDLLGKEDMRFVSALLPNALFGTYVVSQIAPAPATVINASFCADRIASSHGTPDLYPLSNASRAHILKGPRWRHEKSQSPQ